MIRRIPWQRLAAVKKTNKSCLTAYIYPHTLPPTTLLLRQQQRSYSSPLASKDNHPTPTASSSKSKDDVGPLRAYEAQIEDGIIQPDDHQLTVIHLLQSLYSQLESYNPLPVPDKREEAIPPTLWQKLTNNVPPPPPLIPEIPKDVPKGLYLYGSVGCGKSYLMDLFYANLPQKYENSKRRVHFHAFMVDVHKRGHQLKVLEQSGEIELEGDWVVKVARELAKENRVLCFDEFQVTDIADAMILRRLMESLMGFGVVAVMTSNRAPDELYKNGIQREQFVPCIDLIKDRFEVKCLDSEIDYRKRPRALSKVYFDPISPEHQAEFTKLFESLTSTSEVVYSRPLTVWGRQLLIPLSSEKVAKFSFKELCGMPLSASDYLEITKTFETVFVDGIPRLGLDTKDMARRFILFIDAAYEARTKLFLLSDPPIKEIFSDKHGKASDEISNHQRAVMDDLGLTADQVGASSIFTGEEEVFAFARAVSRIAEMSGVQWAQTAKGPEKIEEAK